MTGKARRRDRRVGTQEREDGSSRGRWIVGAVCRWFAANARALPWRARNEDLRDASAARDPYRSLVSEFMLQQTQVGRVLEKFEPFVQRFPTVGALAAAGQDEVLAMWSGLGYYRRARHLHAAAGEIVERFGGRVPECAEELLTLPGVGRYTAGAVASIVFGRAEPIVDGNVARVLMRVEGKELGTADGMRWAWGRAGELLETGARANSQTGRTGRAGPGVFNEGLMELGAMVCVPRGARCGECPLRMRCRARAMGKVEKIPAAKARVTKRQLFCASVVIHDGVGRVLLERRGAGGMWAGLWQAPTLEGPRRAGRREVEQWIGVRGLTRVERFEHGTTHRDVEFEVWAGKGRSRDHQGGRVWKGRGEVQLLALSNAQRRILMGPGGTLK